MLLTLALVVLLASCVAFFSKELMNVGNKIHAIPGLKLLLPLLLASLFIELFEDWARLLFFWSQTLVHRFLAAIAAVLPFKSWNIAIVHIAALFIFSCSPLWLRKYRERRTGQRRPPDATHRLAAILWVVASILLLVPLQ
jgi:hypothetical protein